MKKRICLSFIGLLLSFVALADGPLLFKKKIEVYTRKTGVLVGFQQAKYFNLELGLEHQWKKIRLKKPWTYAVHGRLEYALKQNVIGYKCGVWMKQGRLDFTYGLQGGYYSNAEFGGGNFVFGPELGLKLIGFHFFAGYQYRVKNNELDMEDVVVNGRIVGINPVYVGVRYFLAKNRKTKVKKTPK